MSTPAEIERNQLQQASLYGEPLGVLMRRVIAALDLNQGRLAEVLGLSAPMLSQLMSGRRVKIGNPAVVERLRHLVELTDQVQSGRRLDPSGLQAELDQVRASQPTLTGAQTTGTTATDASTVLGGLRAVATPEQLAAAADAVAPISQPLARLLTHAARRSSRG